MIYLNYDTSSIDDAFELIIINLVSQFLQFFIVINFTHDIVNNSILNIKFTTDSFIDHT